MLTELHTSNEDLNCELTPGEVQVAINKAKVGKAVGIENLPNEVLKLPVICHVLYCLFKKCFESGQIPSVWLRSIINPIPKAQSDDPRVPLNFRGISLLSTVYKLYSSILNARLLSYLEKRHLLVDEQNGFRKERACIDHIHTLCAIIRTRIYQKKPTFACFIDFSKAFDFVNRDLLLYRLLEYGVNGNFYKSLQSLYNDPVACIRVNEFLTDWCSNSYWSKTRRSVIPNLICSLY